MGLEAATYINQLVATNPTGGDVASSSDDHHRLQKSVLLNTMPNFGGRIDASHIEVNFLVGVTSLIQSQLDARAPISNAALTGTPTAPTAAAGTNNTQLATTAYADRKGAITGQSWTGTHNYTGATIAVPTLAAGTNDNRAASTAFVTSAALSTVLPGQSGNAGKYIQTDGTAATWQHPKLARQSHTTSGAFVLNKLNIIRGAGPLAMTVPIPAAGDLIAIAVASNTIGHTIDWGAQLVGGVAPGVMTTSTTQMRTTVLQYDATDGWN